MLRHYDTLGLVRPTGRTVGGYREYSEDDIRRIFHVESLRSLGLSLRQIGRALADPAFTPAALVGDLVRRTEERLRREQELLDRLRAVDASAPFDWRGVLRIVELLNDLGSPDAARRQQAALSPADDAPAPLLAEAVLAEADPYVAGALRWALARAGTDGVATLASGLNSPDATVRRRAARALSELPDPAATAALAPALDDPDPGVRHHAALTLGTRGSATAVPTLVAMIVTGPSDVEAAEALGTLAADPSHAPAILDALTAELTAPSASSAVRIRLTQALAELPRAATRPLLHQLTTDGDRTVAALASALIGSIDRPAQD